MALLGIYKPSIADVQLRFSSSTYLLAVCDTLHFEVDGALNLQIDRFKIIATETRFDHQFAMLSVPLQGV
jgi:hypothetical protein